MPEIHVALDSDDFRKLVAGRAVDTEIKIGGIQFWISIGMKTLDFKGMVEALRDAMEGLGHAPPDGEEPEQEGAQEKEQSAPGEDRGAAQRDASPPHPPGTGGAVREEGE